MRALALVCLLALAGCPNPANAPGLPPDASAAQVSADEALQAMAQAWNASAAVCLNAEGSGALSKGSCASVLLPAHDALMAAASAVDAWNAGSQGNFACAVAGVVAGLVDVSQLLADAKVAVPSEVTAALDLAKAFAGLCAQDAGAE